MIAKYLDERTGIEIDVCHTGRAFIPDRVYTQLSSKGVPHKRLQRGRELGLVDNGTGYSQVKYSIKGVTYRFFIHRLVWLAFNGEISDGYEIDHIDEDKTNNCLENLDLVTRAANMRKCHSSNPHIINNLKQFSSPT